VKAGDPVTFSVLAYPNEGFHGKVAQVRINPQTVNNVVTYDVVVFADNTGGKLLPGMTANATVDVATARDALTIPLVALHASSQQTTPWGDVSGPGAGGAVATGSTARLVVDRKGKPIPIEVEVQLTNGTQAAVEPLQNDALAAGDQVVIGSNSAHPNSGASNQSARPPASGSPLGAMRGLH